MRSRLFGLLCVAMLAGALSAGISLYAVSPACAAQGWTVVDTGVSQALNSVTFVDPQHGWAVGDAGRILVTRDGGVTWVPQVSWTNSSLTSVVFLDATHGFAAGYNVFMYTNDGGEQWWQCESEYEFTGLTFFDRKHGWATDRGSRILATSDGGAHWKVKKTAGKDLLFGLKFSSSKNAVAVGGNSNDEGVIYSTHDGGTTWKRHKTPNGEAISAADFADSTRGWAVGSWGTIMRTTDGGASWKMQKSNTSASLVSVAAVDAATAWVCGSGGTILRTSDGGSTWVPQRLMQPAAEPHEDGAPDTPVAQGLGAIRHLGGQSLCAVGDDGVVVVTDTNGQDASVTQTPTTITLTGPSTISVGKSVKLTAHVSPAIPGGKVLIDLVRVGDASWFTNWYWWWSDEARTTFTKSFKLSARGKWRAIAYYTGYRENDTVYATCWSATKIITVK